MATFRIHEDQENRRPELHSQKDFVKNSSQQSRTILGVIDNNSKKFNANNAANLKQPFTNFTDLKKGENAFAKQPSRKPIPAVPVAQFEAFNVYEDKVEEKKNVAKKSVQNDDQKCLPAKEKQPEKETNESPMSISQGSCGKDNGSPMSLEKSLVLCNSLNKSLRVRPEREIFFDIPEYRHDIHKYLREAELRNRPKPGYMKKQPDITYAMRTILVDWLVEVAEEYRLQNETLYLAVSYIDRFLSYMSVVRAKLQLVGTAAMFLASKYEEIYPPDIGEFVYITDDTYNKKQVIRMEQLILKVLHFDISIPTPLTFLTTYCAWTEQTERVLYLAMYICELSMLEADPYLQHLPSMLAASSIYLARDTLEHEPWTSEMEAKTSYTYRHMQQCIAHLKVSYANAATLQQQAITDKYKNVKYQQVSMILPRYQLAADAEAAADEHDNKLDSGVFL